jgi:hypothetical protein
MDRERREQRDHDNLNDSEGDHKVGMDFRGLLHHPGMDHVGDADVEVNIYFIHRNDEPRAAIFNSIGPQILCV